MKDILFKDGCEYFYESIGIPEERALELDYRVRLIMHELSKPTRDGVVQYRDSQIVKLFLALGETEEERIFLSFIAGRQVQMLDFTMDDYSEDEMYER